MLKNILLSLSFISISLGFFSQFGVLSGVVANKTTGDKIEMARIKIEGIIGFGQNFIGIEVHEN